MERCRIALFVVLSIIIGDIFPHEYSLPGWQAAEDWIKSTMDPAIDPCEDFVGFACGKWNETYNVSESMYEIDRVNKLLATTIRKAIGNVKENDVKTPNYKKSVKIFFDQCNKMIGKANFYRDEDKKELLTGEIYKTFVEYLVPQLKHSVDDHELYPWEVNNTNEYFWQFAGTMQRVFGTSFVVEAEVVPLAVGGCESTPMLHLRPSQALMFPTSDLLTNVVKHVANYHNKSFSNEDIEETKKTLTAFHGEIDGFSLSITKAMWREQYDKLNFRVLKYDQLQIEYPGINWQAFFRGLIPDDMRDSYLKANPTIIIEYEKYFMNVSSIIDKHGYLTATNTGFFIAMLKYQLFFFGERMKTIDRRGMVYPVFDDDNCLELTIQYFSPACLRLLCDEYKIDVAEWRNDFLQIKNLIFSSFKMLIKTTDWLSEDEKMRILNKVKRVAFYGDIPAWINDDIILNAKTPLYKTNVSMVTNDASAQSELFKQQLRPLLTGIMDDAPPTFMQNAWNVVTGAGSIRFPVGYQMPPHYMYSYPLAIKFGAMGRIMGHELLHSFSSLMYTDNVHHQTDKLNFQNSTVEKMRQRIECVAPYYNVYCDTDPLLREYYEAYAEYNLICEIGISNVEENAADTEGLKVAYTAYQFAKQTFGDEPVLPNLVKYTGDQLFFMGFARRICASGRQLEFVHPGDTHSSTRARIEQPLANFPPFAKAFSCKPGQLYWRNKTCNVYGRAIE